ncbi:MAG: transglycosylase SLT domain-containing protein, partial [Nitrospirota bacterium]
MMWYLKLVLRYAAVAVVFGLVAVSVFPGTSAASVNRFALSEPWPHPCPAPMRHQVDFWIKIFTKYTTKQAVIHDNRYLNIIYSAIDLTEEQSNSKKARVGVLSFEISKYREILLKLDQLPPDDPDKINELSPEELRIYEMFKEIEGPNKFSEAAERLRAQVGQKDRFQKAMAKSTMYMKDMERIFREEGVPLALTRLPFVESAFELSAYSWASAAGIWQFTEPTGKIFLRMNAIVDERIDPMKSTRAAARLLNENYAQLGSWPLAVTAYNHGAAGMSKAMKTLYTKDISEIVEKYKGPAFGFSSRNYYAEFLAVLEILEDYQSYFGDIDFKDPDEFEVLRTGRPIKVSTIASACSLDDIRRLNPELKSSVMESKASLPNDYFLKLPPGIKDSLKHIETPLPTEHKSVSKKRKTDTASKYTSKKKQETPSEEKAVHIKPDTPHTESAKKTAPADTEKAPDATIADKKTAVADIAKNIAKNERKDSDKKPDTTPADTAKSDKKTNTATTAKNTSKPEHKDSDKKSETSPADTAKSDKKTNTVTTAKNTSKPEHKDSDKKSETSPADT